MELNWCSFCCAVQSYQGTERLLDVECVGGGGVFRPDIPDPEMCQASSTLLWELTLFRVCMCVLKNGILRYRGGGVHRIRLSDIRLNLLKKDNS